jgi:hypothetical protein
MTKICALCLNKIDKFVKSHIIPKSFYEEFREKELTGFSKNSYPKRYQNGIYGEFLCETCEKKFNQYDELAAKLIKQGLSRQIIGGAGEKELSYFENAFNYKKNLHQFGLSVLWRASASGRKEYEALALGDYKEAIRTSLLNDAFSEELLGKTGMLFEEYRGGVTEFNQAFCPYSKHKKSKIFKETYGNFHCHNLGFPYGELKIRLGGDSPKQGFFEFEDELKHARTAVIWTNNLSTSYPNWSFSKYPQPDSKVRQLISPLTKTREK